MIKPLLLSILFGGIVQLQAQNYYMPTPEGFGASATGGGNATPVTVTTYNDFETQISSAGPKVILVSGTITLTSQISKVVNDKTILGLPGARFINNTQTQSGSGILNLKEGSSNVIIRNLIFEGPGAYDIDGRDNLTAEGCINLWVDHCEFQDGIDGNFDIKGTSDNVTVSWCKFTYLKPPIAGGSGGSNDHRFSNLIGSSSTNAPDDGHYSVTFENCYWSVGCRERMPRARNAELHILNCYYNTDVSSSKALGLGGGINNLTCYVENTNFASIGTVYANYSGSDGGTVAVNFTNCLNGVSNVGTVTAPSYTYTVLPVADVETYVSDATCGAGATLQVTTDAVISSVCDNLGFENPTEWSVKAFPLVADTLLNIQLPSGYGGKSELSVYSMQGQKLFSSVETPNTNGIISVNVSQLSPAMYICTLQANNQSSAIRFIKK